MGACISMHVIVKDFEVGDLGAWLSRPNVHPVVMIVIWRVIPDGTWHGDVVIVNLEIVHHRICATGSRTDTPVAARNGVAIKLDVAGGRRDGVSVKDTRAGV